MIAWEVPSVGTKVDLQGVNEGLDVFLLSLKLRWLVDQTLGVLVVGHCALWRSRVFR